MFHYVGHWNTSISLTMKFLVPEVKQCGLPNPKCGYACYICRQ